MSAVSHESWEQIEILLRDNRTDELRQLLDTLSPGEVARALSRLDDDLQLGLLTSLHPEAAADLIEELDDAQGSDLIEDLPADHAAAIIDEMESDHRADLLGEMTDRDAQAIMSHMDPEEAEDVRTLLTYPPDTAGGIMVTEYVAYPDHLTVGDVLNDLRANAETYSDYGVQYAYVESKNGRLIGVLRLRDLVLSPSETPLTTVMIVNPIYIFDTATLDELDDYFERYNFVGLPVTDEEGRMVGVVRRSDFEEAFSERVERTFMQFSGIIGGDELRSMPWQIRTRRRFMWLVVNLLLSMMAASVVLLFGGIIEKIWIVAAVMPIVANMSGCAGNQSIAVSIREMALGLVQPRDLLHVVRKEVQVSVINGISLGLVLGMFITLLAWLLAYDMRLGLVVGVSLALNMVNSTVLGGSIPLLLRSLGVDPALAAAPLLTTTTDMLSFLLVLSLTWAMFM
jgi:magnesium transporter